MNTPFVRDFYQQNARIVARALLGAQLVHLVDGQRITGRIVETEAYTGVDDLASHGRVKRTPRNTPMWETPGHAYIYLIYGMYWLFNVTCEPVDQPAAVLIRALEPIEGIDIIARNRPNIVPKNWTNGPGRLTRALGIDQRYHQVDLTTTAGGVWLEPGIDIPEDQVVTGARVGLGKHVAEPWLSIPWRWWVKGNKYVSV